MIYNSMREFRVFYFMSFIKSIYIKLDLTSVANYTCIIIVNIYIFVLTLHTYVAIYKLGNDNLFDCYIAQIIHHLPDYTQVSI